MRLARHEELVEAMARAIRVTVGCDMDDDLEQQIATAALDAMLEAAVRLGVGEETRVIAGPKAYSGLMLRMEASDDNA